MRRTALLLALITASLALCWAAERPQGKSDRDNPERLRGEDSKVQRLMRRKLEHSKGLLEGLALADHNRLIRDANALMIVTRQAEWQVMATPRYSLYSEEMQRNLDKLIKGARAKNVDAAALAYVEVTLTCVHCHDYMREVRSARQDGRPDPALRLSQLSSPQGGRAGRPNRSE
jgi:hypothetical protein